MTSDPSEPAAPPAAPPPAPPPPEVPREVWRPATRRAMLILPPMVLVACIAAVLAWQLPQLLSLRTNNAYVRGYVTQIAAEASGRVTEVPVKDYQNVEAGQILARIDDRVPLAQMAEADAALENAKAALANSDQSAISARAALAGRVADQAAARAQLVLMQSDAARAEDLVARQSLPARAGDAARAALGSAQAAVDAATAQIEIARQNIAQVEVVRHELFAQVAIALARQDAAKAHLADTYVRAPVSGQLGEVSVRTGQYVVPGTSLMPLVPEARWIIANFKESQVAGIAAGQAVAIRIDALGREDLRGHVTAISPAAGSEFSVLKPDNATGTFVKVPQRIGVLIAFDPDQPQIARLAPGMSATVTVLAPP